MPNMEKVLNLISVDITRDRTAQLFISERFRLRILSDEITHRNKPTMRIRHRRDIKRILPIQKGVLLSSRYTQNISREN